MQVTIHTVFQDPDTASRAVAALIDNGVRAEDISAFVRNPPANWNLGAHTPSTGEQVEEKATQGITTTTAHDAAAGGMKGAGIGAGIGILAAIAALTIPGFGLVIGGGALATALGGAVATAAGGAVAGGVAGYLMDQGVDEATVGRLTEHVSGGGVLVSVVTPSDQAMADKVSGILSKYADQDAMVRTERSMPVPPPTEANPL
jgi:hypothetical protein